MQKPHTDYQLKDKNTLAIPAEAKHFFSFSKASDLQTLLAMPEYADMPKFVLGGGSNVLFAKDYNGLIIHPENSGIEIIEKSENELSLKVAAGENWDDLVSYCVANGFYGLENLSLIPGNVGAAPVQNIGAYGIEVKDFITEVEFLHLDTLQIEKYSNEACRFDYRNSIFKQELKDKTVILNVTFRLSLQFKPALNYRDVKEEISYIGEVSSLKLRDAIIAIRSRKLPDPAVLPNAGSFFKNPIISEEQYKFLLKTYPSLPAYPAQDQYKIAAGWLIENCGWKGKKLGTAGVYEKQALILVNRHGMNARDLLKLKDSIIQDVEMKFGILLEPEVNIIY